MVAPGWTASFTRSTRDSSRTSSRPATPTKRLASTGAAGKYSNATQPKVTSAGGLADPRIEIHASLQRQRRRRGLFVNPAGVVPPRAADHTADVHRPDHAGG